MGVRLLYLLPLFLPCISAYNSNVCCIVYFVVPHIAFLLLSNASHRGYSFTLPASHSAGCHLSTLPPHPSFFGPFKPG
ncbi:hypothetical protein BDQ12DRAFT_691829 [Crucibulum laeve]|uniref:Secreted protein n=1 Tax=Crucibulum laeve TaxID=68775 RepID=A0A5C3LIM9_9AGAR|nr:hypothetical protein BDQ12DRAFT_691829 [Crucibulum laeve]